MKETPEPFHDQGDPIIYPPTIVVRFSSASSTLFFLLSSSAPPLPSQKVFDTVAQPAGARIIPSSFSHRSQTASCRILLHAESSLSRNRVSTAFAHLGRLLGRSSAVSVPADVGRAVELAGRALHAVPDLARGRRGALGTNQVVDARFKLGE